MWFPSKYWFPVYISDYVENLLPRVHVKKINYCSPLADKLVTQTMYERFVDNSCLMRVLANSFLTEAQIHFFKSVKKGY